MKKSLIKNNGITLIALLITIIVMIILAAVTISMLFGENGVVSKVKQAQEEHIIGQEKEEIRLAYAAAWIKIRPERVKAVDVETELINHRQKDDVEGTDVRDGKKTGILIYYEETDHAYFLEIEDKDVDPEGYIPGEKIELVNKDDYKLDETNIYAILYSNGNLVFNRTGDTYSKYGDVDNAEIFKVRVEEENINKTYSYEYGNASSTTLPPWTGDNVKKVIFEEKIVPVSTQAWFANLKELVEIEGIENLYTDNVKNMMHMFYHCEKLQSLDLETFYTANVENMTDTFAYLETITSLDLTQLDTSKVKSMYHLFTNCTNLKTVKYGSGWNTEKVTDMAGLFSNCTSIEELDFSKYNTKNVTRMEEMFNNCKALKKINFGNTFSTSKVKSMKNMFYYCENLENLNLSKFNTSNVEDMYHMFGRMYKIKILDLSSFNTVKVKNVGHMFCNTNKINKIDMSNFSFESVETYNNMFDYMNSSEKVEIIVNGIDEKNWIELRIKDGIIEKKSNIKINCINN